MSRLLAVARARRPVFNLLAAVVCFGLIGCALYFQYYMGMDPCPLCIFQRIAVGSLGIAFVLAALVPARMRIPGIAASVLIALASLAGAGVAARHLYIQSLPPGEVPVCGAPFELMREMFSAMELLRKVLTGSGECAKVEPILGVPMPAWVLVAALGLGIFGVLLNWRSRR